LCVQISECRSLKQGDGFIVSCMIFNLESVSNVNCREFLRRMETIVFSDYEMIYKFVDSCNADIEKFRCGRSDSTSDSGDGKGKGKGQGIKVSLLILAKPMYHLKSICFFLYFTFEHCWLLFNVT